MKRNHTAGVLLFLIVSLNANSVCRVAAPPLSYGYICGLVSALDTNSRLSKVIVNVSIEPAFTDGDNLTHTIEVVSRYNITNTANHEINFLTSYVRSAFAPQDAYSRAPKNVTIEGISSMFNASVVYNITTRAELPDEISSRYPSGFFSSYLDSQIDMVNLTLAAYSEVSLLVQTNLIVDCWGNYFDFRYGLDILKLGADSSHLSGRFSVSNITPLVRTDLLNSQSRTVNQVDDSLTVTWSIYDWEWGGEITYPGLQLDNDVFSDYLGIQLWQSEYHPPTPNGASSPIEHLLLLLLPVGVLIVALIVWRHVSK